MIIHGLCLIFCVLVLIYSMYIIRRQRHKYKQLLIESRKKYDELLAEYEEKINQRVEEDKQKQLRDAASITHHLSNVISGMNHELSPWIGGIKNKIHRLTSKSSSSIINVEDICYKLRDILKACDSMSSLLDTLSRDVKKVQKYDTFSSSIIDTILSWVRLTITDRSIKENLTKDNFHIDGKSLMFNCMHSPMLVSQVILNLVKNSIEHNPTMLENLKIQIYGDPEMKCLIYEDNGKGIPDEKLESIFTPGVTTKSTDKELHGLGLSLCQDYCMSMGAIIVAEPKSNGARFVIYFEKDKTKATEISRVRRQVRRQQDSKKLNCQWVDNGGN